MPPKKTTTKKTESPSLDDLLSEEPKATEESDVISFEDAEKDALRAELEEAKAKLAAAERERTNPSDASGRPLPEEALTPEQREIRALQDQLAKTKGRNIEAAKEFFEDGESVAVIHVLSDGFTFLGRVWVRGQEIEFGPKAFEETLDRNGFSWLTLTEQEQYQRWGKARFGKGPWPGQRNYEDAPGKDIRTTAPIVEL